MSVCVSCVCVTCVCESIVFVCSLLNARHFFAKQICATCDCLLRAKSENIIYNIKVVSGRRRGKGDEERRGMSGDSG